MIMGYVTCTLESTSVGNPGKPGSPGIPCGPRVPGPP